MIALSYERLTQRSETSWDAAYDCLVTHGPPGMLNIATGVCGLGAMLWLYGVAWHQPMTESLERAQRLLIDSIPAPPALIEQGLAGGDRFIESLRTGLSAGRIGAAPATSSKDPQPVVVDALDAELEARRARVNALKAEGPRTLRAGNWRRAGELCTAWADLDLSSVEALRCKGEALQAQGYHQQALSAFRKAKRLDPDNRTIDAAIERSQNGIVADFLQRYRRGGEAQ